MLDSAVLVGRTDLQELGDVAEGRPRKVAVQLGLVGDALREADVAQVQHRRHRRQHRVLCIDERPIGEGIDFCFLVLGWVRVMARVSIWIRVEVSAMDEGSKHRRMMSSGSGTIQEFTRCPQGDLP